MEYTVGSLIEALSHFDKDLKIENPIILTWHHESETNQTYDSMDDLDDECFETCDKLWIFEESCFSEHLKWHFTVVDDINDK